MAIGKDQLDALVQDQRFNYAGLIKIYDRARSADLNALLAAAVELFPDCMDAPKCPIRVFEKPMWRMIQRESGEYERPQYAISGYMLDEIFIMQDGTAYKG